MRLREADGGAEAAALFAKAEEARTPTPGTMDGAMFDDLRDADDRAGAMFEVLTGNGAYYWVPASTVVSIEPEEIKRPRDLLWRPVTMAVRDGPEGVVYLPTIYHGAEGETDDHHKLGRKTEWIEAAGGAVFGAGLRTYIVGEEGVTVLALGSITFGAA